MLLAAQHGAQPWLMDVNDSGFPLEMNLSGCTEKLENGTMCTCVANSKFNVSSNVLMFVDSTGTLSHFWPR